MSSSSKVPEGAGLTMAQLHSLTAVHPFTANEAICQPIALDAIPAIWKYNK